MDAQDRRKDRHPPPVSGSGRGLPRMDREPPRPEGTGPPDGGTLAQRDRPDPSHDIRVVTRGKSVKPLAKKPLDTVVFRLRRHIGRPRRDSAHARDGGCIAASIRDGQNGNPGLRGAKARESVGNPYNRRSDKRTVWSPALTADQSILKIWCQNRCAKVVYSLYCIQRWGCAPQPRVRVTEITHNTPLGNGLRAGVLRDVLRAPMSHEFCIRTRCTGRIPFAAD